MEIGNNDDMDFIDELDDEQQSNEQKQDPEPDNHQELEKSELKGSDNIDTTNPEEIKEALDKLRKYDNIIIKYGRFLLNKPPRYDEVLGITLASDNQFAEVLS